MDEKLGWLAIILALLTVCGVLVFSLDLTQEGGRRDMEALFSDRMQAFSSGDDQLDARQRYFYMLADAVEEAFPYLSQKEAYFAYDFFDLREYYGEKISQKEMTDQAYLFNLAEFLRFFDDPHTRLNEQLMEGVEKTLLLEVEEERGGLYLSNFHQVLVGQDDYREVLSIGDRLVKVDDRKALELYQLLWDRSPFSLYENTEDIFASRFFVNYYHHFLEDIQPQTCKLDFMKKDGSTYTISLDWNDAQGLLGVNGLVRSVPEKKESYGEYIEDNNLAYIQLNSLDMANLSFFQSELSRMQYTDGLILDLRGLDRVNDHLDFERAILSSFVDRTTTVFYERTRASAHYFTFSPQAEELDSVYFMSDYLPTQYISVSPSSPYYDRPLVVLVDENSLVGPDALLVALQNVADAVLMGRYGDLHVQGSQLQIVTPYPGFDFYLSSSSLYDEEHGRIENTRLDLDQFIPLSDEEAKRSSDPILRAALAWFDD